MATQVTIGNRTTSIPGVYATIKSGIINPPSAVDYGNVVIIDDGTLATSSYIAINGVKGTKKSGLESALEFTEYAQTLPYVWDSELLLLINSLYRPSKRQGVVGVNKLTILQASETTPGTTTFNFAKGALQIETAFEGSSLNGTFVTKTYNPSTNAPISNELGSGLGVKLEPGRAFGYALVFYRGVHTRAEDPLNPGYGFNQKVLPDINQNVPEGTYNIVPPQILFRSPDVRRLSELKKWLEKSNDFKRWFSIKSFTIPDINDDLIAAADITSNQTALAPYKIITGATTTFTPEAYSETVDMVKELDNTFFFCLQSGDDATGVNNTALAQLLTSGTLNWEKYMFVAGYNDSTNLLGTTDSSEYVANYFNSSKIAVVHGAAKVANAEYPDGFRNISQLEKAAKVLGRIAGVPPQTPGTWKDIAIDAEIHKLKESEKEAAIQAGILCTCYDAELTSFIILAAINTLSDNEFLVNEDAQSYDIAIERIKSQINKELIFGAKRTFFGQNIGPNRNTCSPADVITWTQTFLESRVATNERDNLLIRVGNISARIEQDNIWVDYEIVVNGPIKAIIFQGLLLSN